MVSRLFFQTVISYMYIHQDFLIVCTRIQATITFFTGNLRYKNTPDIILNCRFRHVLSNYSDGKDSEN